MRCALGPSDLLALCRAYGTLYVADVPVFTPALRDSARRLVTLLDVAYEERVRLVRVWRARMHARACACMRMCACGMM